MKFRPSIRVRLFAVFLCILLLSCAVLFHRTIQNLDASLEELIETELESDLRLAWLEYSSLFDQLRSSLLRPSTSPRLATLLQRRDIKGLTDFARRSRAELKRVDLLFIVDRSGRILAVAGGDLQGEEPGLANLVARALQEKLPVSATEALSPELLRTGGMSLTASTRPEKKLLFQAIVMPVSGDRGACIGGVVAAAVVTRELLQPLRLRRILGSEVEISITRRGERIVGTGRERRPVAISPEILKKLDEGLSYRGRATMGKEMYLTAFHPLADGSGRTVGSLSVAFPLESYGRIRDGQLRSTGFAAAVGLLLSFSASWIAARQLTRPLRALARSAMKVRGGDLSQQVVECSGGELGELEAAFNAMTEALRQRDETIRKQNEQLVGLNRELEERVTLRTSDLQREKSRLETILTSMTEGVIVVDGESRVLLLNPSGQRQFQTIPSRIIGRPLEELCQSESFSLLVNSLRSGAGAPWELSEERVRACGKELLFKVSPLRDPSGDYCGLLLTVRDITAELEMERMKGEFYEAVSHEFKTPLTSMKGALELLRGEQGGSDGREQSLLNICLRSTERLIGLTGESLKIARFGPGKLRFILEPVRLDQVIEGALEEVGETIRSRGVEIVHRLDPALTTVFGERLRLVKVFANLLSNAIGVSPVGGTVEISSARKGNYLQLSIADHGVGENQAGALSGRGEGVGSKLGLSLCREIIQEHHGRIEYLVGEDGGTLVRVTLPLGEESQDV